MLCNNKSCLVWSLVLITYARPTFGGLLEHSCPLPMQLITLQLALLAIIYAHIYCFQVQ